MRPDRISFSIGGYFGGYIELKSARGGLLYSKTGEGLKEPERFQFVNPSPLQRSEFWQAMERIGVWTWLADYSTPDVLGGTTWTLHLQHGKRQLKTCGENGYPGGDGSEYSPTGDFAQLLRELELLSGIGGIE